jgi:nitroreductase
MGIAKEEVAASVPRTIIGELLDIARYAPTGGNGFCLFSERRTDGSSPFPFIMLPEG